MKKLLNTIYVTTEGCSLRKDGENFLAENEGKTLGRAPLHMLSSIVVFGGIYVSPPLMEACANHGITLVFLDRNGRFQARVEGPVSGNVLLRRAQYKISDTPEDIVKSLVMGKIANQRAVLMRALRDYNDVYDDATKNDLVQTTRQMAHSLSYINQHALGLDVLRGAEGDAARLYFSMFNNLIRSPDLEFAFKGRSRRPPLDPTNALLSFFYTLLTHDCRSALESVGLDPAVGFLHRDRPGRPSLALDLMEELRPIFADRLVLSLINRRQLRSKDFETRDGGACFLTDEARKTALTAWQDRKKEERKHLFLEEDAPLGLVPYLQAQLLARHLRGDIDAYPPWFWK
ncbi:MAG: type I-C CRISPR-associated endonuclease Cas1 [Alphaproteobacteria bacterium]|nr:MAG: type I-C CRISPR-associated endonuclease Cas1 [Alphaproteobacteria bacterium]